MKVIKNLTTEQKDALKFVLEEINPNTPNLSIKVKDLRQIDKICKVIELPHEDIELEDADFTFLKEKFFNYNSWNPHARETILIVADSLEKTNEIED